MCNEIIILPIKCAWLRTFKKRQNLWQTVATDDCQVEKQFTLAIHNSAIYDSVTKTAN